MGVAKYTVLPPLAKRFLMKPCIKKRRKQEQEGKTTTTKNSLGSNCQIISHGNATTYELNTPATHGLAESHLLRYVAVC